MNTFKHWSLQLTPPLLLLLFATDNGPGLWFVMGIPAIASVISVFSLAIKLFKFNQTKKFILRPALTLIIGILYLIVANYSYNSARQEAWVIAQSIQASCRKNENCPIKPQGFTISSSGKEARKRVGAPISYPVIYKRKGENFTLYIYQLHDVGTTFSGGKSIELSSDKGI